MEKAAPLISGLMYLLIKKVLKKIHMKYIFLNLSIAFNVASYIVYKSIAGKPQSTIWFTIFSIGLLLGGLNVFFFTKALKDIQLSIAYPIFSGACIFIIIFLSISFLVKR